MKPAKGLLVASSGVAVVVSVGLIALGICLALSTSGSACVRRLDVPANAMGAVLFGVSLLGVIGALGDEGCVEWLFICFTAALTLALLGYSAFALAITAPVPSAVEGPAGPSSVYAVESFSHWLQSLVTPPDAWAAMATCLAANTSCPALPWTGNDAAAGVAGMESSTGNGSSGTVAAATARDAADMSSLSVIQRGCCFPPIPCNGTTTLSPAPVPSPAQSPALSSSTPSVRHDNHSKLALLRFTATATNTTAPVSCTAIGPGPGERCFSCDSCKAAALKAVRDDLWLAGCVCLVAACVLLMLLCVGGYAHVMLRRERRAKAMEEMRDEDDYSCGSLCGGTGSCGDSCECTLLCFAGMANCLGECGRW